MICLKTIYFKDHPIPENHSSCPICNYKFIFFAIPPIQCPACEEILPDIHRLKSSVNSRILWHKMPKMITHRQGG